jgi:hypothetical protein
MSVLLARSYSSAASSAFLWPSVPLTTTAFTPARRIIRVRVWRKSGRAHLQYSPVSRRLLVRQAGGMRQEDRDAAWHRLPRNHWVLQRNPGSG